jgi:hypothetical protein
MPLGSRPYGDTPFAAPPAWSSGASSGPPERFLLLSPQDSDEATVTASSEVATLPASNLQNVQPTRKWRSSGAVASLNVTGLDVAANTLALVGVNFTSSCWMRVRGADTLDGLTDAPTIDTLLRSPWPGGVRTSAPNWPQHTVLLRWDNDDVLDFWKIDIVDSGVDYLEAGRLMMGRAWQPSDNWDLGGEPIAFDPRDVAAETDRGHTFTDRKTLSAPRQFELRITAGNRREVLDGLAEMQRLRGTWGDVLCCLDPGETTDAHLFTMQGRFLSGPRYAVPPLFDSGGNMIGAGILLREFL